MRQPVAAVSVLGGGNLPRHTGAGCDGGRARERDPHGRRGQQERCGSDHGAKTPCTANTVLSPVVEATPSAPPSYTLTCCICHTDRRFSRTPGGLPRTAAAVVVIEHGLPTVGSSLALPGTPTRRGAGRAG